MTPQLVLSIFPGIGLLDRAFEEQGFVVVRGPDLLWGGNIKTFHPPTGRFDGVIGGPPCQCFSPLVNVNKAMGREPAANLIPEFERVVIEAVPTWYVMENVPLAPVPAIPTHEQHAVVLCDHWTGGETSRRRRFTFGHTDAATAHRFDPETLALAHANSGVCRYGVGRGATDDGQPNRCRQSEKNPRG